MIYVLRKRAMFMRSVLVLAGIVILSAADCNVGAPIGPVDVAITDGGSLTVGLVDETPDATLTPVDPQPLEPILTPLSLARTLKVDPGVPLATSNRFASSVTFAGDLDGGGGTVLAVGASANATGGLYRGAIYLLSYDDAGSLMTTKKIAHGVDETNGTAFTENDNAPTLADADIFGWSIANVGDLYGNGDTVLAVGLPGKTNKGAIHLMSFNTAGNLTGTTTIGSGTTNGPILDTYDSFGSSIVNAGDLYGNRGTVLAVGAQGDNTGGPNRGAVYFLSFNAAGSLIGTTKTISGTDNGPVLVDNDSFGASLANAGDLYGNGGTVLAVGAVNDNTGGKYRGAIYLMSYDATGNLTTTARIAHGVDETNEDDALAPSLANDDYFGRSLANAGDLYGNGGTVLAVGAAGAELSLGAIHLLSFSATGGLVTTTKIASGTTNGPELSSYYYFGTSIANVGNLDGSGGRVLAVGGAGLSLSPTNKTGELQLLYFSSSEE